MTGPIKQNEESDHGWTLFPDAKLATATRQAHRRQADPDEMRDEMPQRFVALTSFDGSYVCAENGGGGAVNANRPARGPWERFEWINLGDGTVALRASNGAYVCAEGGGGHGVVADRAAIGPWETFKADQLVGDPRYGFKSVNGQYLCAERGGGHEVVADRNGLGPWELFNVEEA